MCASYCRARISYWSQKVNPVKRGWPQPCCINFDFLCEKSAFRSGNTNGRFLQNLNIMNTKKSFETLISIAIIALLLTYIRNCNFPMFSGLRKID